MPAYEHPARLESVFAKRIADGSLHAGRIDHDRPFLKPRRNRVYDRYDSRRRNGDKDDLRVLDAKILALVENRRLVPSALRRLLERPSDQPFAYYRYSHTAKIISFSAQKGNTDINLTL